MEIGSSPHDPFEPQAPLQDAPLQDAPLQDAFEYMPEVAHFETRPAPPPQKKAFGGFKAGLRDMFSTHVSKSPLRIRLVAVVFAALFLLFIGGSPISASSRTRIRIGAKLPMRCPPQGPIWSIAMARFWRRTSR